MANTRKGRPTTPQIQSSSALLLAYDLTRKASRLGFDWPDVAGVVAKMDEEVEELKEALSFHERRKIEDELGDLFFVLVNIARFLRINPEKALLKTIDKFNSRFSYVEKSLKKMGKSFRQSNLTEMDHFWEEAKKEGSGHSCPE